MDSINIQLDTIHMVNSLIDKYDIEMNENYQLVFYNLASGFFSALYDKIMLDDTEKLVNHITEIINMGINDKGSLLINPTSQLIMIHESVSSITKQ